MPQMARRPFERLVHLAIGECDDFRGRRDHIARRCRERPGVLRKMRWVRGQSQTESGYDRHLSHLALGSGLKYAPAFHIFYEERVMDLADGLPKFTDMPDFFWWQR